MESPVFLRFYYLDPIHDICYLCLRLMIDGKKAMSLRISGGEQATKFVNMKNRGRVYSHAINTRRRF